jgi:spermidine synthase
VLPWKLIDTTDVPDGTVPLRLMQRGQEFTIKLGQNELMSSRLFGSEEALATLTCFRLADMKAPKLLIGGYGMGFTLRAALKVLGPQAKITVVELVPAIVAWARGPMVELTGDSLQDPRVTIVEGDVVTAIKAARASYDAILLDVDNGPEGLTRKSNNALYDLSGLHASLAALRPGGVLAVWSSFPHPSFTALLRKAGFKTEEIPIRAAGPRGGARHVIWLATKPHAAAVKASTPAAKKSTTKPAVPKTAARKPAGQPPAKRKTAIKKTKP